MGKRTRDLQPWPFPEARGGPNLLLTHAACSTNSGIPIHLCKWSAWPSKKGNYKIWRTFQLHSQPWRQRFQQPLLAAAGPHNLIIGEYGQVYRIGDDHNWTRGLAIVAIPTRGLNPLVFLIDFDKWPQLGIINLGITWHTRYPQSQTDLNVFRYLSTFQSSDVHQVASRVRIGGWGGGQKWFKGQV